LLFDPQGRLLACEGNEFGGQDGIIWGEEDSIFCCRCRRPLDFGLGPLFL